MVLVTGPTGNDIGQHISSRLLHAGVAAPTFGRGLERRIDPDV